jgi:HSP20 family protein
MNENYEGTSDVEQTRPRRTLVPPADIYETKDSVHLVADMPGVDEKSVDITLQKSVLTITGRVEPRDTEGFRRVYAEFEEGDYSRSFQLSGEVDSSKIKATMKNGVLHVSVPKLKPAQKKIPVLAE